MKHKDDLAFGQTLANRWNEDDLLPTAYVPQTIESLTTTPSKHLASLERVSRVAALTKVGDMQTALASQWLHNRSSCDRSIRIDFEAESQKKGIIFSRSEKLRASLKIEIR